MFRHLQSFVMQPNDRKERETLCSPRRAHHSLVPPSLPYIIRRPFDNYSQIENDITAQRGDFFHLSVPSRNV
jgi:hypothetical protein